MRKWAWVIVVALLGIVFFLSSIPGLKVLPVLSFINSLMVSMDLTFVRFSQWLASLVPGDLGELYFIDTVTQDFLSYARDNPVIIEFLLRKIAHIVVFFVITIAIFFLLHQYIKSATIAVILSFLGGGVVSVLDEYRQTFVDGRFGSVFDVMINMIGVTLAICLILFSLFITRSGRQKYFHKDVEMKKEETEPTKEEVEPKELQETPVVDEDINNKTTDKEKADSSAKEEI